MIEAVKQQMSEKQIVEAFKIFFERNILPSVTENEEIMREWNHLSKIITSQPIDYTQVEFYLHMSNRAGPTSLVPPKISSSNSQTHSNIIENENKYRRNQYMSPNERLNVPYDKFQDKKHSQIGPITNKKKNLANSLQIFQKLLTQNQERLQMLTKKEGGQQRKHTLSHNIPSVNTSVNGLQLRRYER